MNEMYRQSPVKSPDIKTYTINGTRTVLYPCINWSARPNNNQLYTYFKHVSYSIRIQQYPVDKTYNSSNAVF